MFVYLPTFVYLGLHLRRGTCGLTIEESNWITCTVSKGSFLGFVNPDPAPIQLQYLLQRAQSSGCVVLPCLAGGYSTILAPPACCSEGIFLWQAAGGSFCMFPEPRGK